MCSFAVASLIKITIDPLVNYHKLISYADDPKVVGNTSIVARTDYSTHILAGQWLTLVQDNWGNLNETKLTEYLDLSSVPASTGYTITEYQANLVTGRITFNITADKYYSNGILVDSVSAKFPIILNLTPQVTKYATRINCPLILVDKTEMKLQPEALPIKSFKDLLDHILKNQKIDLATFTQFFDIASVPTNAEIEISYNEADLLNRYSIKFVITVTEYYDQEGQNIKSQKDFPFEIKLAIDYPIYTSTFEGWWLGLGIIALVLLTTVTYIGLLNRQALYELVFMRIKNSRRLK